MSRFILAPATPADLDTAAALEFEACRHDAGFKTIWPCGPTQASTQWVIDHWRHDLSEDPSCHLILAKDRTNGDVASFAQWHLFESERDQEEIDREMLKDDYALPHDADVEVGNRLIKNGVRKRHELMGKQPYAYFAALATAPQFRRQGAASMLVSEFTRMADEKGLSAYVEGTQAGVGLYRKHGFREIDQLQLDLKPADGPEVFHTCMVRPAKGQRVNSSTA